MLWLVFLNQEKLENLQLQPSVITNDHGVAKVNHDDLGWPAKDRQALPNSYNVMCMLTCFYSAFHTGQTQHHVRTPFCGALILIKLGRHWQSNPDHRVDFLNPGVIGSNSSWRLQILECLLIKSNMPSTFLSIFTLTQLRVSPLMSHAINTGSTEVLDC